MAGENVQFFGVSTKKTKPPAIIFRATFKDLRTHLSFVILDSVYSRSPQTAPRCVTHCRTPLTPNLLEGGTNGKILAISRTL